MKKKQILSMVDHTLLAPDATLEQIHTICDDGIKYGTASVCIPSSYVSEAKKYSKGQIAICTVIGFPNGYSTTEVKCFEARNAIENGADEIDMVINIGWLKDKRYDALFNEICEVRKATEGKILKVIIETCLLTDIEKIEMCRIVSNSGADFIKTSTGFSKGGATLQDVELFASNITDNLKIKAAGGIRTLEDAEAFIKAGATRLGTSSIVKIVKNQNN